MSPPRSSGSLPETEHDSRTPVSETESSGCENTTIFQTVIFAHMYADIGHLLLSLNCSTEFEDLIFEGIEFHILHQSTPNFTVRLWNIQSII